MVGKWANLRKVAVTAVAVAVAAQLAWPSAPAAARPGRHHNHSHASHRGPGGWVGRPVHHNGRAHTRPVHANHGRHLGHAHHIHASAARPGRHVAQGHAKRQSAVSQHPTVKQHGNGNALGLLKVHVNLGKARGHLNADGLVSDVLGVVPSMRVNPGHHAHAKNSKRPAHHKAKKDRPSPRSPKQHHRTTTHRTQPHRTTPTVHHRHRPSAPAFATVRHHRVQHRAQHHPITHGNQHARTHRHHAHPRLRRSKPLSTQFFEQVTRPGSPAMILSLVVLMCLIGTGFVVLMGRRRKPKASG